MGRGSVEPAKLPKRQAWVRIDGPTWSEFGRLCQRSNKTIEEVIGQYVQRSVARSTL